MTHEETLKVFTAYFEDLSADEMMSLNYMNCEIVKYTNLISTFRLFIQPMISKFAVSNERNSQ